MATFSSIQERLYEFLENDTEVQNQILFQLALLIYQMELPDTDLYLLAKMLPLDSLIEIIDYYDGEQIKLPNKKEFRNCFLLATTFYLKEIRGYDWEKIKQILSLPTNDKDFFSPISLGKKIKKIKENLRSRFFKLLKKTEISKEEIRNIEERLL